MRLRIQQARFPWVKTLADGRFIRQHEVVLMVGQTGTGKTHCATALGLAAIGAGFRVRFIRVVELAQELLAAEREFRLPAYRKNWQKIDLVILDELGYLGLGPGGPCPYGGRGAAGDRSGISELTGGQLLDHHPGQLLG